MDTHPPLKMRLHALGVAMEQIQSAALMTSPENSAVRLIDEYEKIEAELTKMEQARMEKAVKSHITRKYAVRRAVN
jgi:hypothetical protein